MLCRRAPEANFPAAAASNDGDEVFVPDEQPGVRQVGRNQSTAAIAAFLLAHPYDLCGEEVEIGKFGRFIGLVCDRCGEERVLEVVGERPDDPGH